MGARLRNQTFANLDRGRDSSSHIVQFYESDDFLAESVARHVANSIRVGDGAIIIATEPHRNAIASRLLAGGIDVAASALRGRLIILDAGETLAKICPGEFPDPNRFDEVIAHPLVALNDASPSHFTQAFGEMVALLWTEGRREAALRLEALWSQLATRTSFSLACAYPMNAFSSPADGEYMAKVCAEHSDVIPAESFTALDSSERERTIAFLQQRASLLESEMTARKKVEEELRGKLAELAENDRRTNEFLAMLGHELRNPLSAMLNAITARI